MPDMVRVLKHAKKTRAPAFDILALPFHFLSAYLQYHRNWSIRIRVLKYLVRTWTMYPIVSLMRLAIVIYHIIQPQQYTRQL